MTVLTFFLHLEIVFFGSSQTHRIELSQSRHDVILVLLARAMPLGLTGERRESDRAGARRARPTAPRRPRFPLNDTFAELPVGCKENQSLICLRRMTECSSRFANTSVDYRA